MSGFIVTINVGINAKYQLTNLKYRIYSEKVILPVLIYGYETWSITLREERRQRVFENEFLR